MNNGENWPGEHYFGYLDMKSHLNDPPRTPRRATHTERKISPLEKKIVIGLWIFDILGILFFLIVGE